MAAGKLVTAWHPYRSLAARQQQKAYFHGPYVTNEPCLI